MPAEADFTALEDDELARWTAHRVFERSVELRAGAEPWVFYEGPPTANGVPGLHHVWARVYKDLFCRFRTMRGYAVPRRAGWDTHGLPVEVEVEKQLGITGKHQIEEQVGIAEFTRLCRESVRNYVDEFKALTERIGYWVDIDAAYWTFSPEYVESVWWHLKSLFDQGLLYEDLKVVPYCPRCGTALSSHELGQPDVYRPVEDESAYVRLPLTDEGAAAGLLRAALGRDTLSGLSLVAWTTTPWTLLSNTGVAVGPDLDLRRRGRRDGRGRGGDIVAVDLVASVLRRGRGDRAATPGSVAGRAALRPPVRRPGPAPGRCRTGGWRVVAGEFVTTDEGTGLVHLAPAFGEVDRQIGRENGLPTLNPVGPDGRFTDAVAWLAGPVGAGDQPRHQRPAGGLGTAGQAVAPTSTPTRTAGAAAPPLIYWGKPSWYVATSSRKDELLAARTRPSTGTPSTSGTAASGSGWPTTSTGPCPGTATGGRRCRSGAAGEGHVRCVGSLAELSDLAGRDVSGIDPHRPAIDEVTVRLRRRAGRGRRDMRAGGAGDRRLVRLGLHAGGPVGLPPGARARRSRSPSRPTSSARPSTRPGAGSTRCWPSTPWSSASHPLPQRGVPRAHRRRRRQEDVQVLGNVIDPWEILDTRGADAMRWWMFSPGVPVDADPGRASTPSTPPCGTCC